MPHSPYTKTIHPPIDDENLRKWNEDLRRHRARWDREEEDSSAEYDLLEIGEFFSKHIEFLATKLDIEVRISFTDDILAETVDIADETGLSFT